MSTRGTRKTDPRLERTSDQWLSLPNRWGVPVDVGAGPVCRSRGRSYRARRDRRGAGVLETAGTLERLAEADPARPRGRSYADARIDRVVLTPDVHKGAGIPLPRTFISGR
jgi:tRNA-splicing ligase RtcB (3'-phosphate/5'-hydroxy nucleic acid ligase)